MCKGMNKARRAIIAAEINRQIAKRGYSYEKAYKIMEAYYETKNYQYIEPDKTQVRELAIALNEDLNRLMTWVAYELWTH